MPQGKLLDKLRALHESLPQENVTQVQDIREFCEGLKIGTDTFSFADREFLLPILESAQKNNNTTTILKSRQVGFTVSQSAIMAHAALAIPGIQIMYCSYGQTHMRYISRSLFRKFLRQRATWEISKQEEAIESYNLSNGTIVTFISGSGAFIQARGYKIDLLCVDEVEKLELDELPNMLEGMAASKFNRRIIGGTGTPENTTWHKEWLKSSQGKWDDKLKKWIHKDAQYPGYHITQRMMPYWTLESEEEKRKNYSQLKFETETLGIFSLNAGAPILPQDVRRNADGESWHTPQGNQYIAGIDLAGGGMASTVITICESIDHMLYMRYAAKIDDKHTDDIAPKIHEILNHWQPTQIVSDALGNADTLHELRKTHNITAYNMGASHDPIKFTNTDTHSINKSFFVSRVIQRFQNGTIRVPLAEPWVIDHLTAETAELIHKREGGTYTKYDNAPGRQDDLLMALTFVEAGLYSGQGTSGFMRASWQE